MGIGSCNSKPKQCLDELLWRHEGCVSVFPSSDNGMFTQDLIQSECCTTYCILLTKNRDLRDLCLTETANIMRFIFYQENVRLVTMMFLISEDVLSGVKHIATPLFESLGLVRYFPFIQH